MFTTMSSNSPINHTCSPTCIYTLRQRSHVLQHVLNFQSSTTHVHQHVLKFSINDHTCPSTCFYTVNHQSSRNLLLQYTRCHGDASYLEIKKKPKYKINLTLFTTQLGRNIIINQFDIIYTVIEKNIYVLGDVGRCRA